MNINYHHLYYFWCVAKEGNLTMAANKLHTSQSSVSMQIKKLEERLGVNLFDREGRILKLSSRGRLALEYAEQIFNKGKELVDILKEAPHSYQKTLRIGAISTLSRNFQEAFINPLFNQPDIHLVLQSGRLDDLLSLLSSYQIDVVLSNTPPVGDEKQQWHCRRIAKQIVSIIGKPKRGRQKPFKLPDDLCHYPLLLPAKDSDMRQSFDLLCDEWEIEPHIVAEVDDMAMLRLLARDIPNALAILPKVVVLDELKSGKLVEYSHLPSVYENFYAIHNKGQYLNVLYKNILSNKLKI